MQAELHDAGGAASVPSIEQYRTRLEGVLRRQGGRAHTGRYRDPAGLVSIVTVTFNSAGTIDRTIDSVSAQSYADIEYIVVDGASTDGTLDRLSDRADAIDLWISGRDDGISDAFNRGISLASGEFIMLLNSDDWIDPGHIGIAVETLRASAADYVFGDMLIHEPNGTKAGVLKGDAAYPQRIRHSMPFLNHPTVVCRGEAYGKYGLFDVALRNAMDYEWFLRVHVAGGHGEYVPGLIGHMTLEGRSDAQFNRSLAEVRDISIRYGYPAWLGWVRFGLRVAKGAARRTAARILPATTYKRLRRAVNSGYET